MKGFIYRMSKHQGPTAQHGELYSVSCDVIMEKRIFKEYQKTL